MNFLSFVIFCFRSESSPTLAHFDTRDYANPLMTFPSTHMSRVAEVIGMDILLAYRSSSRRTPIYWQKRLRITFELTSRTFSAKYDLFGFGRAFEKLRSINANDCLRSKEVPGDESTR